MYAIRSYYEILRNLLASLQSELGDKIQLIGVSGDEDDIEQAKRLQVSPGILILCNMSDGVEASADVKVKDVVEHVPDYASQPQFEAPVITGAENNGKLVISWSEIDFVSIGEPNAIVEYKLLKGATLDEIKEMKNVAATVKTGVNDKQRNNFV